MRYKSLVLGEGHFLVYNVADPVPRLARATGAPVVPDSLQLSLGHDLR